jgi:hypothetical protein
MYLVIDTLNDYEIIQDFKTIKEAKQFIKGLKEFDKRQNNPFETNYIIEKEVIKKCLKKN